MMHNRSSSTRPPMTVKPWLTTVLGSQGVSFCDSDGPSPTKKRRLSRPPSRAPSKTPLSRNSTPSNSFGFYVEDTEELHDDRRTSSLKVLETWSRLAEKYSKALDEDDIVDLRSLTLLKDRGMVFGDKSKKWQIGCFADASPDEDNDSIGANDDDDEVDEIDAFASSSRPASDEESLELDKFEIMRRLGRIPPVEQMGPEEANDLKEFLEQEEARKAQYGDLDDEETSELAEWNTDGDEFDLNKNESLVAEVTDSDSRRSQEEYYVEIDRDESPAQRSDSVLSGGSRSNRRLTSPPIDIRPRCLCMVLE